MAPKAMAITSSVRSKAPDAPRPSSTRPASSTMPWMALVPDMSGV